ncbi:16S rRNA (guanine(527)-N(7))-methyltransferase RsmG [Jannaschia donghaensis]|uniref:Ribosomal RNA small subunit methyltransferase G n=1 Tax=Jannaschia donghaensis TaxID=420998 RepID=A0A0M6YGU6_9RHOB|nr:16S rRNA (guanine(527)-N(7))-methyltransferase RsmG [Jannaschia donghaensis]CTQ49180.1 Ribosomal RNA small subunit methyltransferase G [Jannaschia donghaensis]
MTEDAVRGVSRETSDQLLQLVQKWNTKINLVAPSTLSQFHDKHIVDAIDLVACAQAGGKWLDLGSGGGFPGLVVAALDGGVRDVTLIESDRRKCAFLATARRELGLTCNILKTRIEDAEFQNASVISARALASLPKLLALSTPHVADNGELLFLKGRNWRDEDVEARRSWEYDLEVIDGTGNHGSVILRIRNARRTGR